jgi:copper chaperone CopZ
MTMTDDTGTLTTKRRIDPAAGHTAHLIVPGMGSDHCAGLVSTSLKRVDGVESVQTNIPNHKVAVRFDPRRAERAALRAAIERAGYDVAGEAALEAAAAREGVSVNAWLVRKLRQTLTPVQTRVTGKRIQGFAKS